MKKVAFITGISGQDGSYLADLLLSKGYEVHGLMRRSSVFNTGRIDHIINNPEVNGKSFVLHYGDLNDYTSIYNIIIKHRPNEIYNLGAQSHVKISFDMPIYTGQVDGMGTLNVLECIRQYEEQTGEKIRYYQASSSEMFGKVQEVPQKETTPLYPRSPYGCAKVYSHHLTINYRESYGMHASSGILFNHESPRRGENFVTRKITRAIGRIHYGLQNELRLGNVEALRDWGFAGDYVEAMWLMLQQEVPDDYIIATGKMISVKEFCHYAFDLVGLDYNKYIVIDPRYFRPAEVDQLLGDSSKARKNLGWMPKVDVFNLAKMMVDADMQLAKKEYILKKHGIEDTNLVTI
jgi:GDPmannose 4,6-dehydratase